MKDFKKLIVWQKSMELFIEVHRLAKKLPTEEKYEIGSQLRRSAFSIPANIAEGSAKRTNAHYKQFLENSLGSAYETETALIAISTLYEFLGEEADKLLERTAEIQKMLIAFINKLN
ncbi:four helix bundle protein [Flavitalea sp. BT771]|uniref:four helix bundle protein n=1 Tax=Flavitalea sp. BT771 TaxID=3063329 RepID=UPI0026E1DFF2|nr:four helix bundle protein [Flavitalea sp. BT771]MDO6429162.1 four helix bundle protein [Flavitalea sp. BT771]MDV6218710.1 four helix bundle protein [Flavitalea sp. BT771]